MAFSHTVVDFPFPGGHAPLPMFRDDKRQITKHVAGSAELPITRIESAFTITCYHCGRQTEGREIEIELPKSVGQRNVVWIRVPDGWWLRGPMLLNASAACPGCMETPLDVHVESVAPPPSAADDDRDE